MADDGGAVGSGVASNHFPAGADSMHLVPEAGESRPDLGSMLQDLGLGLAAEDLRVSEGGSAPLPEAPKPFPEAPKPPEKHGRRPKA